MAILALSPYSVQAEPLRLSVAENGRYLVRENGEPFFYLGDTAWELFHRLNREEAATYLRKRSERGFTVIQAVALAELDGLNDPNAYGHRPLVENDPTKPDVQAGDANDYWDHVDYVVGEAEALGLYVGMLPTWGDKWNKKWGVGPEIFTPENAAVYGEWLARRYREKPIIWILGGDRPIENDMHHQIIRAMADGLSRGDDGHHLITFHPPGGQGSAQWFHDEPWLDFNMRQNGHVLEFTDHYAKTREDYGRKPAKPIIDGEPIYEGHPISFNAKQFGHSVAADVRRPLYWDLFSGACGHTYGHHSVWQMWSSERAPVNDPLVPWDQALDAPGATQMRCGRRLIESRPLQNRMPDDSLIVSDSVKTLVPGTGTRRFVATRDSAGSYAMIYAPVGRSFKVRMDVISGPRVRAWWYDPRSGEAHSVGEFPNAGQREFLPPGSGELLDWVLVLDDVARGYSAPGKGISSP